MGEGASVAGEQKVEMLFGDVLVLELYDVAVLNSGTRILGLGGGLDLVLIDSCPATW